MRDLCPVGFNGAIGWINPVDTGFQTLDRFLKSRNTMSEQSDRDAINNMLRRFEIPDKTWINLQLRILGDYLQESTYTAPHDSDVLRTTYKHLARDLFSLLPDPDVLQPPVSSTRFDIHSHYMPILRLSYICHQDHSSDALFSCFLNYFYLIERYAPSDKPIVAKCRQAVLEYFVTKTHDPVFICSQLGPYKHSQLQSCILADVSNPSGDPGKVIPAIWLLFYGLNQVDRHVPFPFLVRQVFLAILQNSKASTWKHPLLPHVRLMGAGFICDKMGSLLLDPRYNSPEDLNEAEMLQCIKALSAEMLPGGVSKIERFSVPLNRETMYSLNDEQSAQVEGLRSNVKSLYLNVVAEFISLCRQPVEEVKPFRRDAFIKIYSGFAYYHNDVAVDPTSQMNFAQSVSDLLSDLLASESHSPDTQDEISLRMEIIRAICNCSIDEEALEWLDHGGAAKLLLEAMDRHRELQYFVKWEEELLYQHCRRVVENGLYC
ncbi:hypothetical protein VKT23_007571 [Stygiomarasmius scandens]|uniref:Uncharacterized protein n=1 Tax=Marasmiellus scandens TaxID=2682957 RepID=A0ABR1JPX6_9AGAR